MASGEMTEIRCKRCNRLLMKAECLFAEIKCPKCGYKNIIQLDEKGTPPFLIRMDGDKFATLPELPKLAVV